MAITRATNLAAVGSGLGANPAQPIDVGPGIQMDGSSTGIITATTFSGTATNAGTAVNIGVGATGYSLVLSGDLTAANVTVGGTLTYDDVTNIDSVGLITARNGLQVLAGISTLNGQTNLANVNVSAAASFSGNISIADSIFHTGDTDTAIRFPSNNVLTVETAGGEAIRVDAGRRLLVGTDSSANYGGITGIFQIDGTTNAALALKRSSDNNSEPLFVLAKSRGTSDSPTVVNSGDGLGGIRFAGYDGSDYVTQAASILCAVDGTPGSNDLPGRLTFNTTADGAATVTERLRLDSRGSFQFSNGFMSETVKINTTARTGTQAVNLDDGMVHYFSTNSSGTWKPNFTMSAGNDINGTIATGDVFSPTMIVAKGATSHFANAIQVDGSDVTPEFSGGAPTEGGGSGTFDVYNYTIIKTGNDTFKAFAAVSTYE